MLSDSGMEGRYRNEFPNGEIETYRTIPELKEKTKWYLDNPGARLEKPPPPSK